jgi:DNA-binding YbaB/EbfC family protein
MDGIGQNLNNLMKEAQKMQERMQQAQQELTEMMVFGEAGGGMVRIEMNGRHDALKTKINPSLLEEGIDMIEDLVTAAINDAVRKVEKASKDKIAKLTAGMQLPPNFLEGQDE